MTTATQTPTTPIGPHVRPGTEDRRLRALLEGATMLQGAMLALLFLDTGGRWPGRVARATVVLVVTCVATWYERRAGRPGLGLTALVLGVAGTVAGAGIGPLYVAKLGASVATVAGMVTLVTGLILLVTSAILLTRTLSGWSRLLMIPAASFVLVFVLYPLTIAVNATNRPPTPIGATTPADLGLSYRNASFQTADGVALSAWYVPSSSGSAVVLLHGSGSTRSSVLDHAVVLARHGYGVLLLDTRGHGLSGGHAMDFGWYGDLDIAAAVSYLQARPDVRQGRIAAVGMSMGGEQAIAAAGSDPRIAAVVAEGVTGMQPADHGWLPNGFDGWVQRRIDRITYGSAAWMSGAHPPMRLQDAISASAPRPLLLIAASTVPDEAVAARYFRRASPGSVTLWVVRGAGHTGGLRTQPATWEARVTGFLDRALGNGGTG